MWGAFSPTKPIEKKTWVIYYDLLPSVIGYFNVFVLYSFTESAKSRSILNDMILEANEIRENQQYRQQAINQAKQLQNHIEETVLV